jgi:hypothetical protein
MKLLASASKLLAAQMASMWSDDVVLEKKPHDLMRAYGCTFEAAERVLNNELTRRKLRR